MTSLDQLRYIKAVCDEVGALIFVQVIPYPPSLPRYEAMWDFLAARWYPAWVNGQGKSLGADAIDKTLPNRRARRLVEQAGLPCLDLASLAAQAARFDEFHQFTFSAPLGHFSPDDNLYVALVLLAALGERGLLPPAVTRERLGAVWKERFSHIQTPYFPPPPPADGDALPGGDILARGQVVFSSGTTATADRFVRRGHFADVLEVRYPGDHVSTGDLIEYQFDIPPGAASRAGFVAVEICCPAVDEDLGGAVTQSVRLGNQVVWSSPVGSNLQGRWIPMALRWPDGEDTGTVSIQVKAARAFHRSPRGEFPLLLRLRRLSLREPPS
jgi:hypothetical protein